MISAGMVPDLRRLGSAGIAHGPQPRLEAFQRQGAGLGHRVLDEEGGAAELGDLGLDVDVLAVVRGHLEDRARLQQGEAGAAGISPAS